MARSRAWRRHQRNRVIRNREKFIKEYGVDVGRHGNELAKRHPLDCGCAQCKLCHPSKYYENGNHRD